MADSNPLDPRTITLMLDKARAGDSEATEQIWREMYGEVHRIARGFAGREAAGPTIQASMLINEAYLRLFGGSVPEWSDRKHFLNTVARSMGQFLIDHARSRDAKKRGGNRKAVPMTIAVGELAKFETAHRDAAEAMEALGVLETDSPVAGQVVRLRFILGLSVDQTAEALGIAPTTVKKKWKYGKAWLLHRLDSKLNRDADVN